MFHDGLMTRYLATTSTNTAIAAIAAANPPHIRFDTTHLRLPVRQVPCLALLRSCAVRSERRERRTREIARAVGESFGASCKSQLGSAGDAARRRPQAVAVPEDHLQRTLGPILARRALGGVCVQ